MHNIENVVQEFINQIKLPSESGRKLNYLMVVPRFVVSSNLAYSFPYGLAMVCSALKVSGREVFTLNLNYKSDYLNLLRNTIEKNNIDVVLSGGLSGHYSLLREIFDTAKSVNNNIVTVVGGGICTADPQIAMSALESVDYGVIGEGEIAVNELAFALENDSYQIEIPGVISRKSPPPPKEIGNLDILPFPDYDGLEFKEVLSDERNSAMDFSEGIDNRVNVHMSRSCPYNCTFCFHPNGLKYRRRSIENVLTEVKWLMSKYKVTTFGFLDELFISDINLSELHSFCLAMKDLNVTWWIQTRVDTVTRDILKMLKTSGCVEVLFGVESADDRILKSMKKGITVKQIEQAFDWAKDVGIKATGNLIFGDIEETEETVQNTLSWWASHPYYSIYLSMIITYPGSTIYQKACDRKQIADRVEYLREGNFLINISKMSNASFAELRAKINVMHQREDGRSRKFMLDISEIKKSIEGRLKYSKLIGVWPATKNNIELLQLLWSCDIEADSRIRLINTNPDDIRVKSINMSKTVFNPDIIVNEGIDTVLIVSRIKSVVGDIVDEIKHKYPNAGRIIILSDIFDD